MAKGAVGLTAGYWPEDIYRYLAVPSLSLDDGLLVRPGKRRPEQPALIVGTAAHSYRDLTQQVERALPAFRTVAGSGSGRITLAIQTMPDLFVLALAALKARCAVLIPDLDGAAGSVRDAIRAFHADTVIVEPAIADSVTPIGEDTWSIVDVESFLGSGNPPGRAAAGRLDLKAPVLGFMDHKRGLVYHSHSSLIAWAVSWSAFVPLTEASVVLSIEPISRLGGLLAATATLFRGGTCVFEDPQPSGELADAIRTYQPQFVMSSLSVAARLADQSGPLKQAMLDWVLGVFATVDGPFRVRDRRRIEAAIGVPLLTVYGDLAAGPVFAAHPSWSLEEAAGIPVTNVDVWPLNPANGTSLQVPWEAIEYGEVGVRSPMTAAEQGQVGAADATARSDWLRTGVVANMDPNGLYYLLW